MLAGRAVLHISPRRARGGGKAQFWRLFSCFGISELHLRQGKLAHTLLCSLLSLKNVLGMTGSLLQGQAGCRRNPLSQGGWLREEGVWLSQWAGGLWGSGFQVWRLLRTWGDSRRLNCGFCWLKNASTSVISKSQTFSSSPPPNCRKGETH